MLNDGVSPTPGCGKLFGPGAESHRLLINYEPVMSEHSVNTVTNHSTKFPTKFPTKEGQRARQNVQTPGRRRSLRPLTFLIGDGLRAPRVQGALRSTYATSFSTTSLGDVSPASLTAVMRTRTTLPGVNVFKSVVDSLTV